MYRPANDPWQSFLGFVSPYEDSWDHSTTRHSDTLPHTFLLSRRCRRTPSVLWLWTFSQAILQHAEISIMMHCCRIFLGMSSSSYDLGPPWFVCASCTSLRDAVHLLWLFQRLNYREISLNVLNVRREVNRNTVCERFLITIYTSTAVILAMSWHTFSSKYFLAPPHSCFFYGNPWALCWIMQWLLVQKFNTVVVIATIKYLSVRGLTQEISHGILGVMLDANSWIALSDDFFHPSSGW
jgi:hypothetical protein